jgi:hypothetical protein
MARTHAPRPQIWRRSRAARLLLAFDVLGPADELVAAIAGAWRAC